MSEPRSSTSLFRPGANCSSVTHARRVALLVDGAAYFDAFARAAERAQRSIIIVAWDFDSRTTLQVDERGRPVTVIGDFLNDLATRRRALRIHVLDWDYPMIFAHDRELPPIFGLGWTPHRRVRFRFDDTHSLAGSHHQKLVVIDDRLAFVGGMDLACRRWDTPAHLPEDPRRVANGKPYPPWHDVMMALDDDAASALARIARERWRTATGETLAPVDAIGDPWPPSLAPDLTDVRVGIACTAPPVNGRRGVRHVEHLYLDMIARAKRCIYIENQYFTSNKVAEALAARLAAPDGPEIVLVTRQLGRGWLEEVTMHVLRTRLIRHLRAADLRGRFHAYHPHIAGLASWTCIDTHSKVMIVDDEWLRVGSANLSNRSMGVDSECDVVVEARGLARVTHAIRDFRDRLVAEHLGVGADDVARAVERAGSMSAAIDSLGSEQRQLAPLDAPERSNGLVTAASVADLEQPVPLEAFIERFVPDPEPARPARIRTVALAIAAMLLILAFVWRAAPVADFITAERVIAWSQALADQWWAPAVIVIAYTPASVVMFPRPLITLTSAVCFGPWPGFAYAMSGVLVASAAGYHAGRSLGRRAVRRLAGRRLNRISLELRKRSMLAVTLVRLVPIGPFVVESLVAGAMRISFWRYMLGTLLGTLPGVLAATLLGDLLGSALQGRASGDPWVTAGAIVALATLAIATLSGRRRIGRLLGD